MIELQVEQEIYEPLGRKFLQDQLSKIDALKNEGPKFPLPSFTLTPFKHGNATSTGSTADLLGPKFKSLLFDETLLLNSRICDDKKQISIFRALDEKCSQYEELYLTDNHIILSKNGQIVKKTFVAQFPVDGVLWCSFPSDEEPQMPLKKKKVSTKLDTSKILETKPLICIWGKQNLEVHDDVEGTHVSLTLPFEAKNVFKTNYGLFLQRKPSAAEEMMAKKKEDECPFPFFFTLSHPMNEVLPVVYKPSDKKHSSARYTTNLNLHALYVESQHSLLFCYDSKHHCHSLWSLRKTTDEDAYSAAKYLEQSVLSTATTVGYVKNVLDTSAASTVVGRRTTTPLFGLRDSSLIAVAASPLNPNRDPSNKPTINDDQSSSVTATTSQLLSTTSDMSKLNTMPGSSLATTTGTTSSSLMSNNMMVTQDSTASSSLATGAIAASSVSSVETSSLLDENPIFRQPTSTIKQTRRSTAAMTAQKFCSPSAISSNSQLWSTGKGQKLSQKHMHLVKNDHLISPAVSRILGLIKNKNRSASSQASNFSPLSNFSIKSTPRTRRTNRTINISDLGAQDLLASTECSQFWTAEPLIPEMCIDHLWTEGSISDNIKRNEESPKASKTFICEDFCGQKFFCYHVCERQQLKCLKLYYNNQGQVKINSCDTLINCRDAALTSEKHIIVVLDLNYDLALYTGVTKICYLKLGLRGLLTPAPVSSVDRTATSAYSSSTPAIDRTAKCQLLPTTAPKDPSSTVRLPATFLSPVVCNTASTTFAGLSSSSAATTTTAPATAMMIEKIPFVRPEIYGLESLATESKEFLIKFYDNQISKKATVSLSDLIFTSSDWASLLYKTLNTCGIPRDKLMDFFVEIYIRSNNDDQHEIDNNEYGTEGIATFCAGGRRRIASTATCDLENDRDDEEEDCETLLIRFLGCLARFLGFSGKMGQLLKITDQNYAKKLRVKKLKVITNEQEDDDEDWLYLTRIRNFSKNESKFANLSQFSEEIQSLNANAALFSYLPSIFYNLHCCYEEMKLKRSNWRLPDLKIFAWFLSNLASVLKLPSYVDLYERDFSALMSKKCGFFIAENDFKRLIFPSYLVSESWSIFSTIDRLHVKTTQKWSITVNQSCTSLKLICTLYAILYGKIENAKSLDKTVSILSAQKSINKVQDFMAKDGIWSKIGEILNNSRNNAEAFERIIRFAIDSLKFDFFAMPLGILLPLMEFVDPQVFSPLYNIDMNSISGIEEDPSQQNSISQFKSQKSSSSSREDGMTNIDHDLVAHLRYSANDKRLQVVRRYLRSSAPIRIVLKQQPGQSDHDYREDQEHFLMARCAQSLMLPTGRGMFTLRTCQHLFDDTASRDAPGLAEVTSAAVGSRIPKLNLSGKSIAQNLTVELTHIEVPLNFDLWPQFHNGVAAALKISPSAASRPLPGTKSSSNVLITANQSDLISAWITSTAVWTSSGVLGAVAVNQVNNNNNVGNANNQQQQQATGANAQVNSNNNNNNLTSANAAQTQGLPATQSLAPDAAGFLLGLGLNGLLEHLSLYNVHDYLARADPMTSLAILIGLSVNKAGTKDSVTTKILTTHLPFLLPQTLFELNIDPQVQNAAVFGLGLVHAGSSNYRLAEALVKEMRQPASASTDHMSDRESYALSCGFALGLVLLGKGNLIFNDPDFTLADELILLVNGGQKKAHHYAPPCNQSHLVKEGDFVNIHITSVPATVALGLMYLKSDDESIAKILEPPDTLTLLDSVRPDLLTVRTVCRNLIKFSLIQPTKRWVDGQTPECVRRLLPLLSARLTSSENFNAAVVSSHLATGSDVCGVVDWETVAQTYCYTTAGACLSLALKFAGTANAQAFEVLIYYVKMFMASCQHAATFAPVLRKAGNYASETCLNVILLSLAIVMAGTGNLDVFRIIRLFKKRLSLGANYLIPHMALGLLFLGCGRYSLKTDDLSLSVLFCAFFPKFPSNTNDNRYHLQALRHLYVLACEQRLLCTVEDNDENLVCCNVKVIFKATSSYDRTTIDLKTPCMLPEWDKLESVELNDERYFPLKFDGEYGLEKLKSTVVNGQSLNVRRRAGFLTNNVDPIGYKSSTSKVLFKTPGSWYVSDVPQGKQDCFSNFNDLKDYCIRNECLNAFPFLMDLFIITESNSYSTFDVWQMKLLKDYCNSRTANSGSLLPSIRSVLCPEVISNLNFIIESRIIDDIDKDELKQYIGKWVITPEKSRSPSKKSIHSCLQAPKFKLGEFLTFFDLVSREKWEELQIRDYRHLRSFVEKLIHSGMPLTSIIVLQRILLR